MTGLSKAHEVLVMDGSMKFIPLTIPPDDAQFLQTRQFSVEETARMFGIPPHLLMQTEKTTTWGTGIAEQSLAFIRYTLNDWYKRIEGRVTMSLCPYNAITNQPQQYAEFDVSPLLKGDQAARYASYAVARATGWLCGNEIRTMEGMETGDDPSLNAYGPTVITVPTLPKAKEPQDA
jgi:HK97 family phage portal protein